MKHKSKYYKFNLIFIIFNIFVFFTMFIPAVSIDKYTEYEFPNGYYNEIYQTHITPIATKIKPITIIESIGTKRSDLYKIKQDYMEYKNELDFKLTNGEINISEYNRLLSSHPSTNKYKFLAINLGDDPETTRLEGLTFLYSILTLIFYIVCTVTLISNLLNIKLRKKILTIINLFGGWIMAILMLIFNCYSFGLMLNYEKQISGYSGYIIEKSTLCFSPKFIPIFLMFAFVAYGILAIIINKKEDKEKIQNREIPKAISTFLGGNKNKYKKINSKKSKYKHGSKKKRKL